MSLRLAISFNYASKFNNFILYRPRCWVFPAATSSTMTSSTSNELNFRDSQVAHASKTNFEIIRALLVYKMCSSSLIVQNNKKIMDICRKMLGKTIFRKLMKLTFYGHFVAGEDEYAIKPVISRIKKYGVKSILDYSVEKDILESEAVKKVKKSLVEAIHKPDVRPAVAPKQYQISERYADRTKKVVGVRTYFYESEYQCDKNMETFIKCIDAASVSSGNEGFAAVKLTALGRPQLLQQMSDFLVQMQHLFFLLTKKENEGEEAAKFLDIENFRKKLKQLGVKISYDEDVKWFTMLDVSGDGVIDLLDWGHLKAFEYDLASIFSVKNRQTGQIEQLVPTLTPEGIEEMRNMLQRMDTLAKHAKSVGVRVMVDAEQTYFQPAIRRLTMEMMRLFNRDNAVIFSTYQCYLKAARQYLREDLHHAAVEDFFFGAKLVRGAYAEQERIRAKELSYEDPICPNYEATTAMYESCVEEVLKSIGQRPIGRVSVMTATHNENTIRYVLRKLREYNIKPEQKLICFGQLYGMCDQLSFVLGQSGYSVYKYVPYGPVDEVLPYLSRRALENGSVFSNAKVEQEILWTELKRRLKNRQFSYKP